MEFNQINEIDDGAFNLPKLETLTLNGNHLKILSDSLFAQASKLRAVFLSRNMIQRLNKALEPLHELEMLRLDDNPIEDLDFVKLSKFMNLREVSLRRTKFNLDTVNVSTDDINSSQSKLRELNLSGCPMENGVLS